MDLDPVVEIGQLREELAALEVRESRQKGNFGPRRAELEARLAQLLSAQQSTAPQAPAEGEGTPAQDNAPATPGNSAPPPEPVPVYLTRRGGTRLSIALTDAP